MLPLNDWLPLRNAVAASRSEVPRLPPERFRQSIVEGVAAGARVAALFGARLPGDAPELTAVLADDDSSLLHLAHSELRDASFPSLTPDCPEVHLFEREIFETLGIRPEGHPWLAPVRFPEGARSASVGVMDYYRVEGEEIHEVAVGPVHAGVIEPGHFRFQCHGERVIHLEISLGYQHRGVERAILSGPKKRRLHYAETLAGDTTIGHTVAYCQAIEGLCGCRVPARAQTLRGIALELERLANHTGDLGALAGDVGFLPTASFCGRLRGEWLNLTAELCGNRFGRGFVRSGGVGFDVAAERVAGMSERVREALADLAPSVDLLWSTPSVLSRFEDAGLLSIDTAREIGLVGPAARACGLGRDVRAHFPSGAFQYAHIPVSTARSGDVFARAYVRWLEIQRSGAFVLDQLAALPHGALRAQCEVPEPDRVCVSVVEGWRGEICHVAATDSAGRLCAYKIVDPSFHNWTGLALAMREQPISDFPLCNKSFNLSYCGFDL